MKRFIATVKNIWKIKELRNRILFTLLLLFVYRLGSFIVLPGAIPGVLQKAAAGNGSGAQDLLGLINSFTGGAFSNASILALGIMPYITASIIVQLLGFAVPYFQRLQQREGESGRRKLNQITRLLTVAITLIQGGTYLLYIKNLDAVSPNISEGLFWVTNIIVLATGTVFSMWLGERITDRGIGNGVSLLITAGIINRLPQSFIAESSQRSFGPVFIIEILLLFVVIMATILVVQGVRRIPIQFAKRMVGRGAGSIPAAGARDYIPLKLNSAGVMPIIFAQALMFLPFSVIQAFGQDSSAATSSFMQSMTEFTSIPYNTFYFILIVLFTYVYTALLVNPQQYSEYLKRQNAFIPGVKPGKPTEEFIDSVTTRITLPGSIFLGLIAIFPAFVASFGVERTFALFFGGTSLLILVGVMLDTLQQIESHLLMRRYDGLVKSGHIQGRSGKGIQIGANM